MRLAVCTDLTNAPAQPEPPAEQRDSSLFRDILSLRILHRFWPDWDLSVFHSRHGTRWKIWDFLIGLVAFTLGFALSPYTLKLPAWYYLLVVGGLYGAYLAVFAQVCGVPTPEQHTSSYEILATCILTVAVSYVLFSMTVALVLVRTYGRYIVVIAAGLSLSGMVLPRYWLHNLMRSQPINLVIYGAGRAGKAFQKQLAGLPMFCLKGYIDANPELHGTHSNGLPVLGDIHAFDWRKLRELDADVVVVCVGQSLLAKNAAVLLELPVHGVEVLTMGAFIEQYFGEITLDYDCPYWFASSPSIPGNPSMFAAKRLIDLGLGLPALVLSLPFWPLIGLLIKLDSRGPVLFRQTRVGYRGETFEMYKFRTMAADAEKNGAQWAVRKDPRITRLGRLLRVTRIDEIPQLWNVVKGEMSLVGPRPERPEFVEELSAELPFYGQRHLVPPGLTGLAQIRYRYAASKEEAKRKLAFELYYVRHLSTMFDIEILLKTIPLLMKGSR